MLDRKRTVLTIAAVAALAMTVNLASAQTAPAAAPAAASPAAAPAAGQSALREVPAEATPGAAAAPAAGTPESQPVGDQTQKQPSILQSSWFFPVMFGFLILMWFWSSRSRKKQEQKRKDMLSSLKKGDKVTSIGGVIGTVIEVKEDEVTVKVDEANNIRMKFARWAIRGVGETAKTDAPEEQK